MVIWFKDRPENSDKENLAVLAEVFEQLKVDNFVVCFNRCPRNLTLEKARNFFASCLDSLTSVGKSKLT